LGRQVNERHAASLATVAELEPLGELLGKVCEPVAWHGRRSRGLNPLASKDVALLEVVSRGDFLLNGFRNRDLRPLLYGREGLCLKSPHSFWTVCPLVVQVLI